MIIQQHADKQLTNHTKSYKNTAADIPDKTDSMTLLNTLITSFNQDFTRDLAWTVFAPALLTGAGIRAFKPELTDLRIKWLQSLDAQELTSKTDYRLGRYYESLWAYFLKHDPQYEWIAQNIAITRNGKTLGEMDFIVFDHQNDRFLHIEVAVKYYLFHPIKIQESNILAINDNSHWIGPNTKDNLERKWQHLTQHQCRLSAQPEAIHALQKLGVDYTRLDQALSLKGYVFTPFNTKNLPLLFNNENNLYDYFSTSEFERLAWDNSLLGIIPKQCWLTLTHNKNVITLLDPHNIKNYVELAKSPIMLAEFAENNNLLIEKRRFFVTPKSWP